MPVALYISMFFTVILLLTTAYFLLGGLPLLTLNHDTPLDARFVRGFFSLYYKAVFFAALGAAASYALWGRPAFAAGAAGVALIAEILRRKLIPIMQLLDEQIQSKERSAVTKFRAVHGTALLINLFQLVVLVWGTTKIMA